MLLPPVLAATYALSYGPAALLAYGRIGLYYDFYRPIFIVRASSYEWQQRIDWYGSLWMGGKDEWTTIRFACEMNEFERNPTINLQQALQQSALIEEAEAKRGDPTTSQLSGPPRNR